MATSTHTTSIPQAARTITPYPGYWYRNYKDYGSRLYHMSKHISTMLHPANAASSPLAALSLAPKH